VFKIGFDFPDEAFSSVSLGSGVGVSISGDETGLLGGGGGV
jgi:hypothetical protein